MGKKNAKYFYLIFKLFICLQIYGKIQAKVKATEIEIGTAVAKFQSDDDISLEARMIGIEMKCRQQDKEISHLKTKAEEDIKVIKRLEDRVSVLEASVVDSKTKSDGNLLRQKRLYRLLPPHLQTM